jgi:hypothetical protein
MEDIIILDDFLPLGFQNLLEELCYNVPWFLNQKSVNYLKGTSKYRDKEQFVYSFWKSNNGNSNNALPISQFNHEKLGHYFLIPLQMAAAMKNILFELEPHLYRGKANLTYSNNELIPFPKPPHRDINHLPQTYLKENTWQVVYYVNDSDGETIIYNEKEDLNNIDDYTIKEKIDFKKGRIVFFKGDLFHSASIPSKKYSKRVVINYNLIF